MYDFVGEKGKEEKREGRMDFREAIELMITNTVAIIGIRPKRLPTLGKVSGAIENFAMAVKTFKGFITRKVWLTTVRVRAPSEPPLSPS